MNDDPQVWAIANQKGGVGKTTTVAGVADAMRRRGLPVTVIDFDPQANATAALGLVDVERSVAKLMEPDNRGRVTDSALTEILVSCAGEWSGVQLAPSSLSLAAREYDAHLAQAPHRLRRLIGPADAPHRTRFTLIDCPPSLGQLTVNALNASDYVWIVSEPRADSVTATRRIRDTIEVVAEDYQPSLKIAGVLVNNYPANRIDPAKRVEELRAEWAEQLLPHMIPQRESLPRAREERLPDGTVTRPGRPISAIDSKTAALYDDVLDTMLERTAA